MDSLFSASVTFFDCQFFFFYEFLALDCFDLHIDLKCPFFLHPKHSFSMAGQVLLLNLWPSLPHPKHVSFFPNCEFDFGFLQLFDDDAWRNAAVTWLTVYVGAAFFSRASTFATSRTPEIVSSVCPGILLYRYCLRTSLSRKADNSVTLICVFFFFTRRRISSFVPQF